MPVEGPGSPGLVFRIQASYSGNTRGHIGIVFLFAGVEIKQGCTPSVTHGRFGNGNEHGQHAVCFEQELAQVDRPVLGVFETQLFFLYPWFCGVFLAPEYRYTQTAPHQQKEMMKANRSHDF